MCSVPVGLCHQAAASICLVEKKCSHLQADQTSVRTSCFILLRKIFKVLVVGQADCWIKLYISGAETQDDSLLHAWKYSQPPHPVPRNPARNCWEQKGIVLCVCTMYPFH